MQIQRGSRGSKLQYSLQGPDVFMIWSKFFTSIVVSDVVDTTSRKSASRTGRET